ncbi:MAG: AAA family ATPase [Rhizomicrobium sp.]
MSEGHLAQTAERIADGNPDVSVREFLTKVYIRPKMFWSCVLIPPIIALFLTYLIPPSWEATAEILIRYGSDESAFLTGLIPSDRELLSGQTSAEILQSIPTLVATIRQQHITADDIYQKPQDVLTGYISGYLGMLFPTSLPPGLPGIDPRTLILANNLKKSLQNSSSSSLAISSKDMVQVLQSTSNLPMAMRGDELITVTVPSFNRNKVAAMANGLAHAFIDEYYRVSSADAHHSYEFLSKLAAQANQNVVALEQGNDAVVDPATSRDSTGMVDIARQDPLLENLSKQLADTQARLAQALQLYHPSSVEVTTLSGEARYLQNLLRSQKRIAIASDALEELKVRRYQAENTEKMYQDRLVPISIVEPAFTPKSSISKLIVRYIIGGGVGLVLGIVLGLCLAIVFSVTDRRLHTSWDTEKAFRLPIFGSLPLLRKNSKRRSNEQHLEADPTLVNGVMQIMGHLDTGHAQSAGTVVAISSSCNGEGKTFTALALANALAQGGRHRVLLIDANLGDPALTRTFGEEKAPGFVEGVLASTDLSGYILRARKNAVDFLPAGDTSRRRDLGFYGAFLNNQFDELRAAYTFIIVDTPAVLSGNEALTCSLAADRTLLVASMGASRKPLVRAALRKMRDVGANPNGVILNRQGRILPAFIYDRV